MHDLQFLNSPTTEWSPEQEELWRVIVCLELTLLTHSVVVDYCTDNEHNDIHCFDILDQGITSYPSHVMDDIKDKYRNYIPINRGKHE